MQWQQYCKGESSGGPTTAREAVKEFLRDYVLLDWHPEFFPKRISGQGWDAQIGGEVLGEQGQMQPVSSEQIAVTRLQNQPCFAIFIIAELIAEIRRDAGKETEDAPGCLHCGKRLDNKPRGRNRHYCNDKCRVAEHRKLEQQREREAILREHNGLSDYWQEHHISDELLILLQNILIREGEAAASAATDAILAYAQQERAHGPQQYHKKRQPYKKRNSSM